MLNRRSFTRGLLAASSASLAAPYVRAATPDLPSTIRFGDVGFGFGAPFGEGTAAIADAKGFIAEEFAGTNVKTEFTYFIGTGPAINEAISNRQLDFASYGAVPNVIGKANGLPTTILASYGGTNIYAAVRPDLPIASVADLKGRKIAVQKATIIHWGLVRALEAHGIDQKDVTILDLKNADQLAALAAKSVDAVFGASFLLPLVDKGIAKIVYRSRDLGPRGQGFGAFLVTQEFAKTYPEATQGVVRGFVRAAAWIADPKNRDEAFQIWSRTGTPPELYARNFEGQAFAETFSPLLDDFFVDRYRSVVDFAQENRLIRRGFDVPSFFDRTHVDRAVADLKFASLWPPRRADGTTN